MRKSSVVLVAVATLVACGDDGTGPGDDCIVSAVAVTGAPATLNVGATVTLQANVTSTGCSAAPTIAWSSSLNNTATVSAAGVVTGVAAGPVTITATAGGKSGTATFAIANAPVASIAMSTTRLVVGTGLTSRITATPRDGGGAALTGRTVTWTSRAGAVATVSQSGVVTAGATGSTWIIAESETILDSTEVAVVDARIAYAWNDNPTILGLSVPDVVYSFNISAAANAFTRASAGVYNVSWTGLTVPPGAINAQFVTAYGDVDAGFCMEDNWVTAQLTFRCFDKTGAATDQSSTTVALGSATLTGRSAFAWIDSPAASAEASVTWRHHPLGLSIFSERLATGSYVVRFAGLQRTAGSDREGVIVNAYGGVAAVCQPGAPTSTATGLEVAVRCFDAAGAAVDTRYTILLVDGARAGARLGFALADQPAAATYTPANSAVRGTGSVQITRVNAGTWDVSFTGFYRSGDLKESFLVSPVGNTAGRCWVNHWAYSATQGGAGVVRVSCATTAGVLADLPFSIVAVQ
jgi:hypothetical protein